MKTFEEAWEELGYQYGEEELDSVKLGWELRMNNDTRYVQVLETLFKISEFLGMDLEACEKLPGKPSDVFINAIKAYKERT